MTVVNNGLSGAAALIISGGGFTPFKAIAIGTGSTSIVSGSTNITEEQMRDHAVISLVTTDSTNDTAQFVSTFAITQTLAVTEAGVFNSVTSGAGTMLAGQTFSAVNVANGDTLEVTYKIDFD